MYIHKYTHIYVYMYVYTHTYMYIYIYMIYTYIHMCVCTYVYMKPYTSRCRWWSAAAAALCAAGLPEGSGRAWGDAGNGLWIGPFNGSYWGSTDIYPPRKVDTSWYICYLFISFISMVSRDHHDTILAYWRLFIRGWPIHIPRTWTTVGIKTGMFWQRTQNQLRNYLCTQRDCICLCVRY